jgi:hypothetical protein
MKVYLRTIDFSYKINNGEWKWTMYAILLDTYGIRVLTNYRDYDTCEIHDEYKFSLMMLQYPEYIIKIEK